MKVESPEIKRLIWWWAWRVSKSCTALDAEDVAQELWIRAVEAAQEWKPGSAALSSYLYPVVKWRALKILEKSKGRKSAEETYAHSKDLVSVEQCEVMSSVVSRVRDRLSPPTLQVFDLMINHSEELMEVAKSTAKIDPSSAPSISPIRDHHVARYMGVSAMTMSRLLQQVKTVLEEEIYGDQKSSSR